MFRTASLAPPCAGPHSEAMPAAMQANGLAPDEPDSRTVEVEAFCSWSACRIRMRSMARATVGLILYRSEEHTSELQSLMRISYAVFCLKKKTKNKICSTKTEYRVKKHR